MISMEDSRVKIQRHACSLLTGVLLMTAASVLTAAITVAGDKPKTGDLPELGKPVHVDAVMAAEMPADSMSPAEKAMMEKWMAFSSPGPEHKILEIKVGKWKNHVTMWDADGGPVQESSGTSEFHMTMDGRYLIDETNGTAMGQPFRGMGTTGFDNMKKKYVSTWIDNWGTGVMMGEGTYDAKTRSFTYKTEMPDVMSGKYIPARSVETIADNDNWTMDTYRKMSDGKDFKVMHIDYARMK